MLTRFYAHQKISKGDIFHVKKSLVSDTLTDGDYLKLFEKKIKQELNCKYSLVCNNGTSALYLSLKALNLSEKDYILIPSINFLSSSNVCKLLNLKIIFCDVDPKKGLVTPELLLRTINKCKSRNIHPKVFIPQFHAGQCDDQKKIFRISKKYKIKVLEDACHALGSSYKYNAKFKIGSCKFSNISTFSLHPVKNITSGEGGIITTNDKKIFKKIKMLRNHGIIKNKKIGYSYNINSPSLNFRLSELNCALGYSQIKRINKEKKIKSKLYKFYIKKIRNFNRIEVLEKSKFCNPHWHLFIIFFNFKNLKERSKLMSRLKRNKIGSQIHYKPIYKQNLFKKELKFDTDGAEEYYKNCLSIPFHTGLTTKNIKFVVDKLVSYIS